MAEDYTTVNNPRYLYLAELKHPFPDWAAQAPVPEADEFSKQAAAAFADVKRRLLPISTKEATFYSAINIFADMENFDEDAFDRVKEACAHFGIEKDIEPYVTIFADEIEKSASEEAFPEGRFAIDTELGGQRFRLLPLNDEQDVRSSAHELAKMAADNRIHLLMLVPAAREIVKAAEDYGGITAPLPPTVTRYGYERFPDVVKAAAAIANRHDYCRDESVREKLPAEYEAALVGLEDDPDSAMQKIAAIDEAAGLRTKTSLTHSLPNAFDIVFSGDTVREAEKAATENVYVKDVLVPLVEVKRIGALDADYRLSKEASEDFAKLRDTEDAKDLSLAIGNWSDKDQRTFLRLAVESAA